MNIKSAKTRFFFTFISNILRGGFSFLAGLIVARGLGPNLYGDFIFLIASFAAIRQVLDLGTSSAFYTFLSNRPQGLKFLTFYLIWQFFQFLVPLLLIGLLLPKDVLDQIWLGQEKNIILLSFIAVFFKEQAWKTIAQLGESNRLTLNVQVGNILIAIIHFLVIAILWKFDFLSIYFLFVLIISEYLIAVIIAFKFVYVPHPNTEKFDRKIVFQKYYDYCLPLFLASLMGFIYGLANRWMLQNFGGSEEQAFYGIGYQFAAVGFLITMSLSNILWKEIAEAHEKNSLERLRFLFKKTCRFTYVSGAVFCGFLIFWCEEIIELTLGHAYAAGSYTLAIMLVWSIHKTLGNITGIMLIATNKTVTKLLFDCISVVVSLPLTYLLIGPKNALIPGLELGSLGFALQLTIITFIDVNLRIWWIDRFYSWKFDWQFQFVGLGIGLMVAWLALFVSGSVSDALSLNVVWKFGLSLFIYFVLIGFYLWNYPGIAGLTRAEIKNFLIHGIQFFKRLKDANF